MKKLIVAMAVILMVGLTSAFANKGEEINQRAIASFNNEFASAKNVSWNQDREYFRASFSLNNQVLYAYYDQKGELMAVIHHILSNQLPIYLMSELKKTYKNYWITDLLEMASNEQSNYYVSLDNADETLVLKSDGTNHWTVYKRIKKNIV
jgi:hypothetical protein